VFSDSSPYRDKKVVVSLRFSCAASITHQRTHDIIRSGFDRSPCSPARSTAWARVTARVWKTGNRFADKESHQIFSGAWADDP
jgi:tRNA uridine 5-carboxymethylaminomethyl modification enzyme